MRSLSAGKRGADLSAQMDVVVGKRGRSCDRSIVVSWLDLSELERSPSLLPPAIDRGRVDEAQTPRSLPSGECVTLAGNARRSRARPACVGTATALLEKLIAVPERVASQGPFETSEEARVAIDRELRVAVAELGSEQLKIAEHETKPRLDDFDDEILFAEVMARMTRSKTVVPDWIDAYASGEMLRLDEAAAIADVSDESIRRWASEADDVGQPIGVNFASVWLLSRRRFLDFA